MDELDVSVQHISFIWAAWLRPIFKKSAHQITASNWPISCAAVTQEWLPNTHSCCYGGAPVNLPVSLLFIYMHSRQEKRIERQEGKRGGDRRQFDADNGGSKSARHPGASASAAAAPGSNFLLLSSQYPVSHVSTVRSMRVCTWEHPMSQCVSWGKFIIETGHADGLRGKLALSINALYTCC